MRRISTLAIVMACAALVRTGAGAGAAPATPVIVELFTSEGCSSCPPADALLQRLAGNGDASPAAGAGIIALGEHVDYWDHQGWKDRFASAALTNRQQTYAARFDRESVYTPQMVVDGHVEFVGSDGAAARRAIDRARAAPHGSVRMAIEPGSHGLPGVSTATARQFAVAVTVTDLPAVGRGDRADLLIAVTEDDLRSDVKRGENQGRVLTHAAVVRQLTPIAGTTGSSAAGRADVTIPTDWRLDRIKIVAFVQERRGRAILAAGAVPLATAGR